MLLIEKFKSLLFKPASILPLVFVRAFFGIFALIHALKLLNDENWFNVNFKPYLIQPHYSLFPFINPLPLDDMRIIVTLIATLSVSIFFGFFYRISIVAYTFLFTYLFLMNRQFYQNHYYFIILISFLMCFTPANALFAVDTKLFPKIKKTIVPFYFQFLILFQMSIVYLFGGIAKLNPDWLQGYPMKIWIKSLDSFSILSSFKDSNILPYFLSYSGLLLDLSIVFILINNRTRKIGLALVLLFHILNSILFTIGVFPYLSLILTLLFLDDAFFVSLFQKLQFNIPKLKPTKIKPNKKILYAISIWIAIQLLVPLRSYIFNFNPKWSSVGENFAWRMRLHDYRGDLRYKIVDKINNKTILFDVETNEFKLFPDHQLGFVIRDPETIVLGAKKLADMYFEHMRVMPEVFAIANLSLDERDSQLYIDPKRDLVKVELKTFSEMDILMPINSRKN
jgi:vitamin K-dependent gamma-carboxylase